MPVKSQVKFPLRPTLLVVAAERAYESRSLGELTARKLTGDMERLTAKFSKRAWNIPVIDADDPEMFEKAWQGLEGQNMAVISGYSGTREQMDVLSKLSQIANPVSTLVGLGKSLLLDDAAFRPFQKSLSLLPAGLEEQMQFAHVAMKANRHENAWGKHADQKTDLPAERAGKSEYLN